MIPKSRSCLLVSLFCALLISPTPSFAQIEYYSPENIYHFAEYLYKEGDFARAAVEYERFLFSRNETGLNENITFKIGLCYQHLNMMEKSREYFQRIVSANSDSKATDSALFQIAFTYFSEGKYQESINNIDTYSRLLSNDDIRLEIEHLYGTNLMYGRQWENAHDHFNTMLSNRRITNPNIVTNLLHSYAVEGINLEYKNRSVAILLSTLIPGAGKVYADRTRDGIYSFFTIGLVLWLAYDGFSGDGVNSVKGWIFGSIGATLYLGNIYGSGVAAKIYNDNLERALLERIGIELNF